MCAWNPAKGNRKAGTKPSPKNWRTNKMVIPEPWHGRDGKSYTWFQDLHGATHARHTVHGRQIDSLFQPPRDGFTYGCTPEDVVKVLNLLPPADVSGIEIVAFRQPTRKQTLLSPAWGRLIFFAEFDAASGTCVMLEASKIGTVTKYHRKHSIETAKELDRMREDGHQLIQDRRGWNLVTSEESIRNGMLYRTFLHEVGHDVDLNRFFDDPAYENDRDPWDAYWARSTRDREAAAHRYAAEKVTELRMEGSIPFGRTGDQSGVRQGLPKDNQLT
jgi:hypothetical protein